MSVSTPHYLLFAQASAAPVSSSASGGAKTASSGHWRFELRGPGPLIEAEDDEAETSVERLELLAIVRGLEALEQPSQVTLHTASRAISRGFREGLELWREDDWQWERFGQMTPVKNADLWRRIDQALGIHQVTCRLTRPAGSDDLNAPIPLAAPQTASRKRLGVRELRFDPPAGSAPAELPRTRAMRARAGLKSGKVVASNKLSPLRRLLSSFATLRRLWPFSRAAAD